MIRTYISESILIHTYSFLLRLKGDLGSETKELIELSVSIQIRTDGPEGANTAQAYACLCVYYRQLATEPEQQNIESTMKILDLSEINIKEASL